MQLSNMTSGAGTRGDGGDAPSPGLKVEGKSYNIVLSPSFHIIIDVPKNFFNVSSFCIIASSLSIIATLVYLIIIVHCLTI